MLTIIPTLGTSHSHTGNEMFPRWEYITSLRGSEQYLQSNKEALLQNKGHLLQNKEPLFGRGWLMISRGKVED